MTMNNDSILLYEDNMQIDSLDYSLSLANHILLGLSNLEGNIWDGNLKILVSGSNSVASIAECRCPSGVTKALFAGNNSDIVVSAHDDGYIRLFSTDGLALIDSICAHDDIVSYLSMNLEKETIFTSCGWDGNIKCWDWNSKDKNIPIFSIRDAHYKQINTIEYNPSNYSEFCSGGQDGYLRVWDKRCSNSNNDCSFIIANDNPISCIEWVDNCILTGTDNGSINIIDYRVNNIVNTVYTHSNRIRKLKYYPKESIGSQNILFSASDDTTIVINNIDIIKENECNIIEKKRLSVHQDFVTDLLLIGGSNNNFNLISASSDKTIRFTNIDI